MRFFRPAVQRILNTVMIGAVVGAFAVPLAWGYRLRQEARGWRQTACAYRLREVVQRPDSMRAVAVKDGEDACATLTRLGLDVAAP
jgi:hypothetical protein